MLRGIVLAILITWVVAMMQPYPVVGVSSNVTSTSPNVTSNTTKTGLDTVVVKETAIPSLSPAQDDDGDERSNEEKPPSITNPSSPQKIIVEKDKQTNLMLHCKAKGNPTPTYQWFRDNIALESSTFIQTSSNGTLTFPYFTSRENGRYRCTATNKHGTSLSNEFQVISDKVDQMTKINTENEVKLWSPFSVPCVGIPSFYKGSKIKGIIRWYDQDKDQIDVNDRIGQDEEGTLHLAYVTADDTRKVFQCAHTNPGASSITTVPMGKLIVTDRGNAKVNKKPTLQYTPKYLEAILGEDIVLDCVMAGIPIPEIKWKNSSNHEIQASGNPRFVLEDRNRKLRVKNVANNDEGAFTCIGKNVVDVLEERITINVTSPPRPVAGGALTSQTVPDGKDVVLKCLTQGAPGESVGTPEWYRNGNRLRQGNVPDIERYSFSNDKTQLSISKVDKVDTACFQCNVSNSKGYMFFDAYLRVVDAIQVKKRPQENITIEEDSQVDFTVRAQGDKCCQIHILWHFNSTPINTNMPPFKVDTTTNSLFFEANSLSSKEELRNWMGKYTCRVSNAYQSVNVEVDIRMKKEEKPVEPQKTERPETVTAVKSGMGLWWVYLFCGVIVIVIAVIIVLVIVYKRRNPGETYKLEQQELKHHLNPEEDLLNKSFTEI